MIVQCDKCRTKFRIADERVTAKGVKVRCSRCAHVFVVHRDGEPNFTAEGPDTRRLNPSEMLHLAAQTHPATRDPSDALTQAQPLAQRIPPATSAQAALALGFAGSGLSMGGSARDEAVTVQSSLPSSAPSRSPAPAEEMPAFPSWSTDKTVAAPAMPPPPPPSSGDDHAFPEGDLDGLSLDDNDFFGADHVAGSHDAFDDNPASFPAPQSDFGADPVAAPAPQRFDPPPPGMGSVPRNGGLGTNPFEGPMDRGARAAPLSSPPNPASSPFAAPLDGLGSSADIPGLIPPEALTGADPFADDDDLSELGSDSFNPGPLTPAQGMSNLGTPVARIHLGPAGLPDLSQKWSQAETTAIAAAYDPTERASPPPRKELPLIGDRSGLWPSLLGAVLGVAFVLTFLPEVGQGILDTFTRRGADALNRVSQTRVLPESLQNLRALDTRVSDYRIASGEEVLVVRGVARNLGSTPAKGLSAVALAMDGDTVVARASAPVAVLLSPEVLAGLRSPTEVGGAYAQRSAGALETQVPPGAELPFMVVFPEMPPEARDRVFLVEFVPFAP